MPASKSTYEVTTVIYGIRVVREVFANGFLEARAPSTTCGKEDVAVIDHMPTGRKKRLVWPSATFEHDVIATRLQRVIAGQVLATQEAFIAGHRQHGCHGNVQLQRYRHEPLICARRQR